MQHHFYVAHHGEQMGPLSLDEIVKKIQAKQLDPNDYVYDENQSDWILLMAFPPVSNRLKTLKPLAPPKAKGVGAPPASAAGALNANVKSADGSESVEELKKHEWYVLKGDNKFGPFAYLELIRMLQDRSIYEFDYVWYAGMSTWKRVAELPAFKPDMIRKVKQSEMPELSEVFFRRRHARAAFGASIIVHNNQNVWKGRSIEISAGGAGIVVDNALLQPGQTVYLHFKPGDGVPPFNAVCEVVSKKFMNVKDPNSPIQYGVKFTNINSKTQQAIQEFTSRKAKAA